MKYLLITFPFFLSCFAYDALEADKVAFLENYHSQIYQDIVVKNQVVAVGTDLCEGRYQLIKPILDLYEEDFSVLDLGAAQGYFSFKTAEDYPMSSCVMIESNNTSYYAHHGDMLIDLCFLNAHLQNIFYLDKRVDLSDLNYLNEHEHFDIILAFLVVHLMEENQQDKIEIIESLLTLGDNLILEVANDVDVIHTSYVEFLSEKLDCQYLGEVKRHRDVLSTSTGKLFWFRTKDSSYSNEQEKHPPINKKTFERLNGVFPQEFSK